MSDQPQSIKDFCSMIDEDAAKEIADIIERAEYTANARASQILSDAEEKKKAILAKAAEDANSARRLVLSDLNLELKKVGLKIKGEIVEDTMSLLKQRLSEFRSSPSYAAFLEELAIEGIIILSQSEVVIRIGDLDKDIFTQHSLASVRKRLRELPGKDVNFSLAGETIQGKSGLYVISKDGRLMYDNTLDARIERMDDNLRLIISRKIFG